MKGALAVLGGLAAAGWSGAAWRAREAATARAHADALATAHTVAILDALRARPARGSYEPGTPLTDLLVARLAEGDRELVLSKMSGDAVLLHEGADEPTRRRLELAFAVAFDVGDVVGRVGLVPAMPPEDVHSMARQWSAAGGDTYFADLVVHALEQAGAPLAEGAAVLDFGASSGRVLRVLAAARPDLRCLGCDPNEAAIAWAAAHLPGEWFVSPVVPPLALGDASLDAAYAISIWSHFDGAASRAWLAEMERVLRPGGALVLTTHGWDTLGDGLRTGAVDERTAYDATRAMLAGSEHFVDVFGEAGDWGVRHTGWGNSYFTVDWLVEAAGPGWTLEVLWPGAVLGAQDLIVLRRRSVPS